MSKATLPTGNLTRIIFKSAISGTRGKGSPYGPEHSPFTCQAGDVLDWPAEDAERLIRAGVAEKPVQCRINPVLELTEDDYRKRLALGQVLPNE